MRNIELLNGIAWHFECIALSAAAIENFRPPADGLQMRMHYSLYVTNLMSAIDMMCEAQGHAFETALKGNLNTSNFPGAEVLAYIRELRNGIVHRGLDPTSGGMVIDGVVRAVAPPFVQNGSGTRSYSAPAPLLRDVFIHCEIGAKPVIERFLEPYFAEIVSTTPEAMISEALKAIEAVPYMPDWAKEFAREQIEPQMLAEIQTYQIQKLRRLLRPCADQPIG